MAEINSLIDNIRDAEQEDAISPEMVATTFDAVVEYADGLMENIPLASASATTAGLMSHTDWLKLQTALTYVWLSDGTDENPQIRLNFRAIDGTENSAGIPMASAGNTHAGFLSHTDWLRFNAAAKLFQELWKIAVGEWGSYDAQADRYLIADLSLTYTEALKTYHAGALSFSAEQQYAGGLGIRVNLPPTFGYNNTVTQTQKFYGNGTIEVAILARSPNGFCCFSSVLPTFFSGCKKLRSIPTQIRTDSFSFTGCTALADVKLYGIKANSSFADCPAISSESLSYLITNSAATAEAPVIITVHPDVYAKISGTYSWSGSSSQARIWESLAPLAAAKHITFLSAS